MLQAASARVEGAARGLIRSKTLWFRLAVIAILLVSFNARLHFIKQTVPYCHHVDENTWTSIGVKILQTSDLNPHRFKKPSMMVYLNTAGMALGLVRAGTRPDEVYRPKKLNVGGYPYYSSPTSIYTLKSIYAGVSLLSMILCAWCVRRLSKNRLVALISLAFMAISPIYFSYSWEYLNVDLLGVFFATLAISYAYLRAPSTPPIPAAIVMGVLGGLTLGSKYNLFWIIVPLVAQMMWMSDRYRVERILLFLCAFTLTFVLVTPYAVLDVTTFITHMADEARHYSEGHSAKVIQPGWTMFTVHLGYFSDAYSVVYLLVAVFGLLRLAQRDIRSAVVLFSYPVLLFVYMCSQRVFFGRNVLMLNLTLAMGAAIGFGDLFLLARAWIQTRWSKLSYPVAGGVVATTMLALVLITTPWSHVLASFDSHVESRNEATEWIFERVPEASKILVAEELNFYPVPLKKRYRLISFEGRKANLERLAKKHPGAYAMIPSLGKREGRIEVAPSQVLAEFGEHSIGTRGDKRNNYTLRGNPKFMIVKL